MEILQNLRGLSAELGKQAKAMSLSSSNTCNHSSHIFFLPSLFLFLTLSTIKFLQSSPYDGLILWESLSLHSRILAASFVSWLSLKHKELNKAAGSDLLEKPQVLSSPNMDRNMMSILMACILSFRAPSLKKQLG